jgi:hypothetical protein
LYRGQELIKTHNLDILLKKCSVIDVDFSKFDVKNLDDYAVRARYPEYIAPELSEAQDYYQIASSVKVWKHAACADHRQVSLYSSNNYSI